MAAETMARVHEGALNMNPDVDDFENLFTSPVPERFRGNWTFYILADDQRDRASEAVERLFPCADDMNTISLPPGIGVFEHLAQLLCRLRECYSCIGLLPGLGDLYRAARSWGKGGYEGSFSWHRDQDQPLNWNAKRTVSRLCLGMGGYLFELSPGLWRNIPYHDELPLKTLRTRPRVTVCRSDQTAGTVTLLVQPLPECGYVMNISSNDDPEKVAKTQREKTEEKFPFEPIDILGVVRATSPTTAAGSDG